MEENKEAVEETVEQPVNQVEETKQEQPRDDNGRFSKFESANDDNVIKVDLDNPPEIKQEVVEEKENVVDQKEDSAEEVKEEIKEEVKEEVPVIEEITVEDLKEKPETVEEKIEEAVSEAESTGKPIPENIQKVINFMEETGGDLQDYVNLNRDVDKMDDSEVLDEYYRATKSHLTPEERSYLLEDSFGINEDVDDERTIRMKKIALKEQVAEAKAHLDGQKSKYYEEIKAGSKLTEEQQKAIEFFNRHNKESEDNRKLSEASQTAFKKRTDNLFNDKFKGFEYSVGDKKYRFNIKNVDEIKTTQSDINNFVNKFVGEDKSTIEDAAGYHKSLFAAMNADKIAQHFYEQGKADAVKNRVAKDKNINLEPRKTHGEVNVGGVKYKVLGDSADDFKFKIRSKKK